LRRWIPFSACLECHVEPFCFQDGGGIFTMVTGVQARGQIMYLLPGILQRVQTFPSHMLFSVIIEDLNEFRRPCDSLPQPSGFRRSSISYSQRGLAYKSLGTLGSRAWNIYCSPCTCPLSFFFSSFSFPALFAFWLRSSVVSVLFSLISERPSRGYSKIIPIFAARRQPSVLAHDC